MLDRTHQTTSASLNRHDLGTRLFAQAATTNMVPKSLRIRHPHPVAVAETVRAGIRRVMKYPFEQGKFMAQLPGSTLGKPWSTASRSPRSLSPLPPVRPWVVCERPTVRAVTGASASRARAAGNPGGLALG